MDKKEADIRSVFNELKEMATNTNAETATLKTDDGEWEYIITIKRKKK